MDKDKVDTELVMKAVITFLDDVLGQKGGDGQLIRYVYAVVCRDTVACEDWQATNCAEAYAEVFHDNAKKQGACQEEDLEQALRVLASAAQTALRLGEDERYTIHQLAIMLREATLVSKGFDC